MAEAATKLPLKTEAKGAPVAAPDEWEGLSALRRQVDRLFEDFGRGWGLWRPFGGSLLDFKSGWPGDIVWGRAPAVDLVEKDKEYEITAELPGMDESNIDVKLVNGMLTVSGEKKEEKEEKKKNYYLSERRYGAFQRSFQVPEGVDAEKIEATFKNGVLKIVLPKTAEALKQEKKIAIQAK